MAPRISAGAAGTAACLLTLHQWPNSLRPFRSNSRCGVGVANFCEQRNLRLTDEDPGGPLGPFLAGTDAQFDRGHCVQTRSASRTFSSDAGMLRPFAA